jgi:hypothetical protein
VLPTGNLAVGDKMMDMEKAIIHDAFLTTLFQILVDSPQMTATEVLERAREKGMLLAPTAGRLQAEFLGPLIEREIDLLARQGLMPKMPQILIDAAVEYRIEYDNPLSRMARAEKASGFMRALSQAAEYAKMTQDMEPLDHFDFDAAMPEILDINGAPTHGRARPKTSPRARPALASRASAADDRRRARRRRLMKTAARLLEYLAGEELRIALGDRRHAYRSVFKGPNAEIVLKDLARFCRAHTRPPSTKTNAHMRSPKAGAKCGCASSII